MRSFSPEPWNVLYQKDELFLKAWKFTLQMHEKVFSRQHGKLLFKRLESFSWKARKVFFKGLKKYYAKPYWNTSYLLCVNLLSRILESFIFYRSFKKFFPEPSNHFFAGAFQEAWEWFFRSGEIFVPETCATFFLEAYWLYYGSLENFSLKARKATT